MTVVDTTLPRVLRSVLFVPASNARAVDKARSLPADGVVLDLEDSVAPDRKAAAREAAVAAVRDRAPGRRTVAVRCNPLSTPEGRADLLAVAAARPDAVVVPKVPGPEQLDEVAGLVGPDVRLWPMVESAAGVLAAREIAGHPSVDVLLLGVNDLAQQLRCAAVPGRGPLLPHLAAVLLAGRAAGVEVLDAVYNDVRDLVGFETECRQGAELGFDGKTLVHPAQIEVANRVWAPDPAAVEHARRVIDAFAEAERAGSGVALLDGRMVESLHVVTARRTLALAEAVTALG